MSLTTEIQQFQDESREGWMPEKKADPAAEIQAMREAIRVAHRFIRDIVKNHECGDDTDASGEAAISKLQPFLNP